MQTLPTSETDASTPLPYQSTSLRSIGSSVALFLTGFLFTAIAIHFLISNPLRLYAAMRSEKLELLDEWSERSFSAALGSSHVHNGFDPRAFDSELKGTPLETTSLNLGIEGGSQSEQRAVGLLFVQRLRKPRPTEHQASFVLLELDSGANFRPDHLMHPRSINLYDWRTAKFVFHLSSPELGIQRQIGRNSFALVAAGLHYANVGMLSNLIFSPPLNRDLIEAQTKNDRRGLLNEDADTEDKLSIARTMKDRPSSAFNTKESLVPGNYELLSDLNTAGPAQNISFVYFVLPKLTDLTHFVDYPSEIQESFGTFPIINLARPDRYPMLYDEKYWQDEAHLNEAGARQASRILADELKRWCARNWHIADSGR